MNYNSQQTTKINPKYEPLKKHGGALVKKYAIDF